MSRYTSAAFALVLGAICTAAVACSDSADDSSSSSYSFPAISDETEATGPSILVGPGSSAASIMVCDLLDESELSALAGEPMGSPSPLELGPPLGQHVCTFGALHPDSHTVAQISMISEDGLAEALRAEGFNVQQVFDETFEMFPNSILVPGVADAALRHDDTLEVLAGNVVFSVSLTSTDGTERQAASLETLVAMAELVIQRLEIPR